MIEIKDRPLFPRKNTVNIVITSYELEPEGILNPNNKKVFTKNLSFDSSSLEDAQEKIGKILEGISNVVSENS